VRVAFQVDDPPGVGESLVGGNDTTMWCRSVVSGGLDLDTELPDDLWLWYTPPQQAADEPDTLTMRFEEGVPVALNGQRLSLREMLPLRRGMNSLPFCSAQAAWALFSINRPSVLVANLIHRQPPSKLRAPFGMAQEKPPTQVMYWSFSFAKRPRGE
jgi:hypothetical protein